MKKLIIDATAIEDQLAECEPGEEKSITLTVTSHEGDTIEAEATAIEHIIGGEDYEEESEMEEMPRHKSVPKAILVISKK